MGKAANVCLRGVSALLGIFGLLLFSSACAAPITISSIDDLQLIGHDMAYPLDGDYVLTGDLDASSTEAWNAGAGFDPIGNYDGADPTKSFTGTFDGQGHSISNLFINRPGETYVALFGCVRGPGYVTGLRLKWGSIAGDVCAGGVVGQNEGAVSGCVVKGTSISAVGSVGGVVGSNSGRVDKCYATATVTGSNSFVGGVAGYNIGTIEKCCATGVISGDDNVGGLVGSNTGGVVTETYAACRVAGGAGLSIGGLCGSNSGTVTASFWNADTSFLGLSAGGTGLSMTAMRTSAPYAGAGWDFTGTWGIVEGDSYPYLLGQTTLHNIDTIDQLQAIGTTYPLDEDFVLTQDIDASETSAWNEGKGFNPIGKSGGVLSERFTGRFYGQRHVISGLVIYRLDESNTALFRYLDAGGEIVHLGLENCTVTGKMRVGGLVYDASDSSTIFGCRVTGSVSGPLVTGSYVGGLVGDNSGTVCDSSTSCSITGDGNYGGGLTSFNDGLILRCRAEGTAIGSSPLGGLVGHNDSRGIVAACYAMTAVQGKTNAGGFAGRNEGVITWSYASGSVAGNSTGIGGFAGLNKDGSISECYATGAVTGVKYVGGLVGRNQNGAVHTCYASGAVTGESGLGGLVGVGVGSHSVVSSFWDIETSGQSTSDGGTGLTTKQMKAAASFTGWNFVNIWGIDEGESYPYLLGIFPLRVILPNGGEAWTPASKKQIRWNALAGTGPDVKIELFKDGVFDRLISASTPNNGSFSWTLPAALPTGSGYKVHIYSTTNPSYADFSDGSFSIIEANIRLAYPNGGDRFMPGDPITITWISGSDVGASIKLKLFKSGVFYSWISGPTPNDGSFNWTFPAETPMGNDYTIQIYSATDFSQIDFSDAPFSVSSSRLRLTSPNSSNRFLSGDPVAITWLSGPGVGSDVGLRLFKGGVFSRLISGSTSNDGEFVWTIPADVPSADDYTIQIHSVTDSTIVDFSDTPFSINPPRLRLTSPNGGETWTVGRPRSITWSSFGAVGTEIKLKLFKAGVFDRWISGPTPNDGAFQWKIPADVIPASDYTVQVYSATNFNIIDWSDRAFTIAAQ